MTEYTFGNGNSIYEFIPMEETIHLSVRLGETLCNACLTLFDWHSSMSDPIYAVGSSAIAGKSVTIALLEQAFANLKLCWHDTEMNLRRYSKEDVEGLDELLDDLNVLLMDLDTEE